MPPISRRTLFKVTGLAAAAVAVGTSLESCSSEGGGDTAAGSSQIRIAWQGSAERTALINQAVDSIKPQFPGVTFTTENGADTQFGTKIVAQLSTGAGPDLWLTQILALGDLATKSAAQDLTSYVPKPIDMTTWGQQAVLGAQVKGVQYAVSTGSNTFAAVYDPELTAKAGLAKIDPAWTWDELTEVGAQISQANSAAGVFGLSDCSGDLQSFQVWMRSFGGDLFAADGSFVPTQDNIIEWYELWKKIRSAGACVPPDVATKFSSTGDIAQHSLVLGKAALGWDYSNRFLSIEKLAGRTLGLGPYPQGSQPGMFTRPSVMWMVASQSQNKDVAAQVVNALVNSKEPGLILNGQLGLADNPDIFATVKAASDASTKRVYDYLETAKADYTTELANVVWPAGGSALLQAWTPQAEAVAFGTTSPQDAAQSFLAAVQQALGS